MDDQNPVPSPPPVTDRRPVPRGVMPRRFQTWLMGGLALGIVLIIVLTGEPEPPKASTATAAAPVAQNPDRLREYQERLRVMEARQALEAQAAAPPALPEPSRAEPSAPPPEDPIVAARRKREYDSRFASNVVSSRRPDPERPDSGRPTTTSPLTTPREPGEASLDDIAQAVVRATIRGGGSAEAAGHNLAAQRSTTVMGNEAGVGRQTPERTGPISAAGPTHALLEGTIIDTVLTNRLDGNGVAPVNCLVTNPVYSHSGQHVLIPAGARILGETRPVQALGETRLAVGFHRLVMPDGSTLRLDQFLGLNQIGDAGLRDRVNQHYWSTFGAAGAVGLISGLAQWIGTAGLAGRTGDRTVIVAGGAADGASQASLQVMNRFLNRLPTITIREGHRVKVYLTSDLDLPVYESVASGAGAR
jgi:type IV secretory pathway VirB10-like protein